MELILREERREKSEERMRVVSPFGWETLLIPRLDQRYSGAEMTKKAPAEAEALIDFKQSF
jgi:hypothetical protein